MRMEKCSNANKKVNYAILFHLCYCMNLNQHSVLKKLFSVLLFTTFKSKYSRLGCLSFARSLEFYLISRNFILKHKILR